MFDVGALELLLIGVVALIVVGPERLPKLARTAGLWVGRARRALSSVKDEIDREIKADELREILRKQSESRPLESILEEGAGLAPQAEARRDSSNSDSGSDQNRPFGANSESAPGGHRSETGNAKRQQTISADPP